MPKTRTNIPKPTADAVLAANRHTCCICNTPGEPVHIHHINEDPSHHDAANLAVVCLNCHGRVHQKRGLGRAYTAEEVRTYKQGWEARCATEQGQLEPDAVDHETMVVRAVEHKAYRYPLDEGDSIVVAVQSTRPVDVSVMRGDDYDEWSTDGGDVPALTCSDGLLEGEVDYEVEDDGEYVVMVLNPDSRVPATVVVDIAVWSD